MQRVRVERRREKIPARRWIITPKSLCTLLFINMARNSIISIKENYIYIYIDYSRKNVRVSNNCLKISFYKKFKKLRKFFSDISRAK